MANSNGWGDGAANNSIGWGQGANNAIGWGDIHAKSYAGLTDIVGVTTDPDAQAFITAAAITDPTQQSAINQLVVDLKGYSIWSKMKALYPMVGGSSTSHSYNLINTAQFQISWNGGVTHASTGVTFNGINGYGNTNLSPSSILTKDSNSMSFYGRKTHNQYAYNGVGTPNWFILGRWNNIEYYPNAGPNISHVGNFIGFKTGTRRSSTDVELYFNGTSVATGSISSLNLPSNNFWLGAVNNNGIISFPTDQELAFAHLGDGLSDTEAANFYTAVQAFQTTLGRQV
jgi:hypothetical protein